MAVTVRAVRASNGARDWPREVAGQADHLQPCGDRGRLHRWTASERRSRRRFNLVAKGLISPFRCVLCQPNQRAGTTVGSGRSGARLGQRWVTRKKEK